MPNTPPVIDSSSTFNVYRLQGNNPVFVFPGVEFSDAENSLPSGNWNNTLFSLGTDSFATAPVFGLAYGPNSPVSYVEAAGNASVTNSAATGGNTFNLQWQGLIYYDAGNGPQLIGYRPAAFDNQIAFFHANSTFTFNGISYTTPVVTTDMAEAVVRGATYNEAGAALGYSGAVFLTISDFSNENYDFNGVVQTQAYINVWVSDVQLNDDTAVTKANRATTIDVLANDLAVGAGSLLIVEASSTNGTVTIVTDALGQQQLRYVPDRGFVGTGQIFYSVLDSNNMSRDATVTVTVQPNTVLDFRNTADGAKFDFDNDPATPPTAAAALEVVLGDYFAGGQNPGFLTVYDGTSATPSFGRDVLTDTGIDPSTVTEVFGTEKGTGTFEYGADHFFVGSNQDMTLNGLSGDDIFAITNNASPANPLPKFTVNGGDDGDLLEVNNVQLTEDLTMDASTDGKVRLAAGTVGVNGPFHDYVSYTGIEFISLLGGYGNDVIRGSSVHQTSFSGGDGNDTFIGAGLSEKFRLDNGDDLIYGDGDDGGFASRTDSDVMTLSGNRSDYVITALPDDPFGGKGVLITSALDANGNPLGGATGTDRVYGVETFEFLNGTFTRNEVLGITPENVLDFSATGLIRDFDNDPATPDTYAASVQVELNDFTIGGGGAVLSNYVNNPAYNQFTVADLNSSPLTIGRVIGTSNGDVFSNTSLNTGRTVIFEGRDGDDLYRANTFTGGDTFDGGAGVDTYFIGSSYTELTAIHVNFGIVDTNGFNTVTMNSLAGGTKTNLVKSVEAITTSIEGGDDTIDASSLTVDFNAEVYSGNDIVETGSGNDQVLVSTGIKTLDGGAGTDLVNFSTYYADQTLAKLAIDLEAGSASYTTQRGTGPVVTDTSTVLNFEDVFGSNGDDAISGTSGDNSLNGLAGNDTLVGGLGVDTLYGSDGNDRLIGGAGADLIFGGNDIVVGTEMDTAVYAGRFADYTIGTDATYSYLTFVIETATADGDSLYSIEKIEFADGIYDVSTGVFSPFNVPPSITGDMAATIDEGGGYALTMDDLSFADPDDGASEVTFSASNLSNGYLLVRGVETNDFTGQDIADGVVKFIHDGSETLAAGFSVTVEDGNEDGSAPPAAVPFAFTVTPVNDAPEAVDDQAFEGTEDMQLAGTLVASDVEFNPLTFSVLTGPTRGSLSLGTDGQFIYTPNANANGADSFTYQVDDGFGGVITRNAKLDLAAVDDGSARVVISGDAVEDGVLTAVLNNDDPEGVMLPLLAIQWFRGNVAVSGELDGTYILTDADVGEQITARITYTDGQGFTETVSGDPTNAVTAVDDGSARVVISGDAVEDGVLTAVLNNDDPEGAMLPLLAIQWFRGNVAVSGELDGTYILTDADVGEQITARITYTDGQGFTETVSGDPTNAVTAVDDGSARVVISGDAVEDGVLTAVLNNDDPEGVMLPLLAIQWYRGNVAVSGELDGTYILTDADVGEQITARITYTDGQGFTETVSGDPTNAVTAVDDGSARVVISGDAVEDGVLTAVLNNDDPEGVMLPLLAIQWYRGNVAVSGELDGTYILTDADVGEQITARITYTDGQGFTETVSGDPTNAVTAVDDGSARVVISGDAVEDGVLTAVLNNDDPEGVMLPLLAIQWYRGNVAVSGELDGTYILTDADVGEQITARITYTDGQGFTETVSGDPTNAVTAVDDGSARVVISGDAVEDGVLTAVLNNDDPEGVMLPLLAIQWYRGNVAVSGELDGTYILTDADVGEQITARITYTDGQGFTETVSGDPTNAVTAVDDGSARVVISGDAVEDGVLTAVLNNDDPEGVMLPLLAIQWYRGNVAVSGELDGTYILTDADVGEQITARITYTDGQGFTETVSGDPTNAVTAVDDGSARVVISGDAVEDGVLTAVLNNDDPEGVMLPLLAIQWYRGNVAVSGELDGTYILTDADVGEQITARITYTDGQGFTETVSGDPTNAVTAVDDGSARVVISGDAVEDGVLTAVLNNDDPEGVMLPLLAIQWYRGNVAVSGELDGTYILTDADVGEQIAARITYTDGQGFTETVSGDPTNAVVNVNDDAVIAGVVLGAVTEDAIPGFVSGQLTISDIDSPETFRPVNVAAASANGYGTFTLTAAGAWTYILNNANATVNALNAGQSLSDSFTILSDDGTAQTVSVTINGTTDVVAGNVINGTNSNNPGLVGTSSRDIINALDGDDTVYGRGGADDIYGGNGNDTLYGDFAPGWLGFFQQVLGGGSAGNDKLYGGAGNDSLFGGNGTDLINGGTGADALSGGAGSDSFVFAFGDSGRTAATLDTITDYQKGALGLGDVIDFADPLSIGGSAAAASGTQATINALTGVASFARGSGNSLGDALADIANRFSAATNSVGEFALFRVGGSGSHYLFVSDGVAGVTANDVVVALSGVTTIGSISLNNGDLTILS